MEPTFTVQSLALPAAGGGGDAENKFTCMVRYNSRNYVFRYAYDTQAQAQSVLGNIKRYFGKPAGIDTDLAFNYWQFSRAITISWRYIRRTTQKNSWYIDKGI